MMRLLLAIGVSMLGLSALAASSQPPDPVSAAVANVFLPPGEPPNHKLQGPVPPSPPPPHSKIAPPADPRNFEGGWTGMFNFTEFDARGHWIKPPFTPEGARIFWYRVEKNNAGTPVADPMVQCRPMGAVIAMSAEFGRTLLQTPNELIWMSNEDHLVRRIRIGGTHPRDLKPTYMGDSIGYWDGNTLVIDSIGFNDRTWLDYNGRPHSKQLHLIERMRKIDGGYQLEDLMTIEDPVMYTRPWTARLAWDWAPITGPALEVICEENNVELGDFTQPDLQKHDP